MTFRLNLDDLPPQIETSNEPSIETTAPDFASIATNWNRDVWAPERLGQAYAATIESLWDQLRGSENALRDLVQVSFDSITIGSIGESESLPHGISHRQLGKSRQRLSKADFIALLPTDLSQDLNLEQSEWRHVAFWPNQGGAPQSLYKFTLHLLKPDPEQRWIVRGQIKLRWRLLDESDLASIDSISVTEAEILSRSGPTPFGHVIPADVTPSRDAVVFEPNLQVHDLDHNGLADIIVSRINRVYWNQGQGQFRQTPLCDFPLPFLDTGLFEDFNGDGHTDFLAVNSEGIALFSGDPNGRFPTPPISSSLPRHALKNPFLITSGDIDKDGDLDLWLAQYRSPYQNGQMPTPFYDANDGHASYLLTNNGQGQFEDQTAESELTAKRFRRTYSASFFDYDQDQDQDLIVISDFAGIDIHQNQGKGRFKDVTQDLISENHAFGMAHCFGDWDANGRPDVFMIGMNAPTAHRLEELNLGLPHAQDYTRMRREMSTGNRLLFQTSSGFQQKKESQALAETGWSWGVAPGDFDNDGDEDIYIVNGHISSASVTDYEKDFWLYDIYLGDSNENEALAEYFEEKQKRIRATGASFGGHEMNRFFLNLGNASFIEVGYLFGLSLGIDCRNLVSEDLDGDGKLEWLLSTFETYPQAKQALHLFPNFTEQAGNWIGAQLHGTSGATVVGAVVTLKSKTGEQNRYIVNGDSYRSQKSNSVHFGIGNSEGVESLTVRWTTGKTSVLEAPQINTYHRIEAVGDHFAPSSN